MSHGIRRNAAVCVSSLFHQEGAMGIKAFLLGSICCGASVLTPGLAKAQSAPDMDKIDRLQRQVEQLQEQLKSRTD
jgi:hypothetical protein